MTAGQFREKGFLHAVFVEEKTEIGVVDDGDNVDALFG